MTLPTRTLADDPPEHLSDHNALHTRYNEVPPNLGAVRFVAKTGDDANSGWRWDTAKLTVAAAVTSLPLHGTGAQIRREGTIYIGEGIFQEQGIPTNLNLRFIGTGSTYTGGDGTVIQLPDGAIDHMFRPSSGFTSYSHHIYFEKMTLDGNKGNQTGQWDLVNLTQGGFNTVFRDVFFNNASGYGLRTHGWINNAYLINCTGGGCERGLFHFDNGPWMLGFIGGQFSGCGGVDNGYSTMFIGPSTSSAMGQIYIEGVKVETNDDVRAETVYMLTYRPNDSGGHPQLITARNVSAATSTPNGGIAIFHEENRGGHGAIWDLQDIDSAGNGKYRHVFWSEKTGQKTISTPHPTTGATNNAARVNQARFMHRNVGDAFWPSIEIMGVAIDAGRGSPEGVVGRPVGSQWMRTDGGAGTSYYVKESNPPVASQGTLTMDTNPTNGDTLTVGGKVYTFQTTLTDVDGNVQIGATVADTQANLVAAFGRTGTSGTQYAEATVHHVQVTMAAFVANVAVLTARVAGISGDLFGTTETFTAATNVFNGATLGTTTAGSDGKTGWVAK